MSESGSPNSSNHSGKDSPVSAPIVFSSITKKQINNKRSANEGKPNSNTSNSNKHTNNFTRKKDGEKKNLTGISASEDSDSDEYSVERNEETKYCKALMDGRKCCDDATLDKVIINILLALSYDSIGSTNYFEGKLWVFTTTNRRR